MARILLGLTTTPKSDWRSKIKEIDELELQEIALFPTFLSPTEREELYERLLKTKLKKIPHVHLRHDFEEKEMNFLSEHYDTEVFNIHHHEESLALLDNDRYRKKIFIENLYGLLPGFQDVVRKSGGLCLDFSHGEDYGHLQENDAYTEELLHLTRDNEIGCAHISAVSNEQQESYGDSDIILYSAHTFSKLSEFDYLHRFKSLFPKKYVSLELENSFAEQLKVRKYLKNQNIGLE